MGISTKILILAAVLWAPQIWAIRSCIIDGGGRVTPHSSSETARLCGSQATFPLIRGIYNSGQTSERLLSGSGRSPDCHFGRFYRRVDGRDRVVVRDNADASPNYYRDSAMLERLKSVRFNAHQTRPFNRRSSVHPATHSNVTNQCLSGVGNQEVCHVWSMNHGQNRGVGGGSIIKLMDEETEAADFYASELRNMISSSNCHTTRFVLNNCNSGGMLSAVLNQNGRVIPNVCGSSSTTEHEKSRGRGTSPPDNARPRRLGQDSNIIPSFPTYHHIHAFTDLLSNAETTGNQRTMDTANFHSLMTNPVSELPLISSDFYLNKFANERNSGNHDYLGTADPLARARALHRAERHMSRHCTVDIDKPLLPLREVNTQVTSVLRQMGAAGFVMQAQSDLTNAEFTNARVQLENALWKIRHFEVTALCQEDFWDGACHQLSSEAEKRRYVRQKYDEWKQERKNLIDKARICRRKCRRSSELEDSRQRCIEQDCAKSLKRLDSFIRGNKWFRRYEHLKLSYSRERQLYEHGSAEQIRDFFLLKDCERGDFYERTPANTRGGQ